MRIDHSAGRAPGDRAAPGRVLSLTAIAGTRAAARAACHGAPGSAGPLRRLPRPPVFVIRVPQAGRCTLIMHGPLRAAALTAPGPKRVPLHRLHTHGFELADLARAIETLAGEVPGEDTVHVAIRPEAPA